PRRSSDLPESVRDVLRRVHREPALTEKDRVRLRPNAYEDAERADILDVGDVAAMSFRGVHRLAESLHERLIEATFGLEERVRFLLRRVPVSVLRDRIFSGAPLYPVPGEVHAVESPPREAFRLVPLLAFEDVVRQQALPALHSHRWVAPNHPGKPVQSFGYPPAAPA